MNPIIAEIVRQPQRLDCLKHPVVLQMEALDYSLFHLIAFILFVLAIIHTLSVVKIHKWARSLELKHPPRRNGKKPERKFFVHLLYFFSEVEIVFALWTIPLFIVMVGFFGWTAGIEYINSRDYTEPLFVVVILAMASTKPIVHAAEQMILWIAHRLGNSLSIWWFTLLTVGPLLGSLITEAGAMALCALLLSRHFYLYHPSPKLAYATVGLLFVNISVGGVLTDFASPAVLILAHVWEWSISDMFVSFGWKAAVGIVASNLLYWILFRKELAVLTARKKAMALYSSFSTLKTETEIPHWVTVAHILFMTWIVVVAHYPALFIASFLFFIGFHQATRSHQCPINLARPMLVGLFLAGLLIHGGLQGWWVVKILADLTPLSVLGVSIALTAFNDNTAISYLSTLVPNWGEMYKYAVFTGVIAGGGLTVIANAPNPAGYAILKKHFDNGIRPLKLFLAALIPTMILYAVFYFFGPLF